MAPAEQRALRRAAILLLVLSAARWGTAQWPGSEATPSNLTARLEGVGSGEAGGRGPEDLLRRSRSARDEVERRSRPLDPGERLDPNRADAAELDRLPGIGPALAEALVRHRREVGPFASPGDLEAVPGIGPKLSSRLAPLLDLSQVPAAGVSRPRTERTRRPAPPHTVDINRAAVDELVTLPGIGPALARRIVEGRAKAPFRSVQDLGRVPGIGPATLRRLEGRVVVRHGG